MVVHTKNSVMRKLVFSFVTLLLVITVSFVLCEMLVRIFSSQPSMYPRWDFSDRYGFENNANTVTVHEAPGRWKFIYSTNEYRYRGKAVPVSNKYEKTNIVVLGDSSSFGIGVNDGEEYPAIVQERLGQDYSVINLGVGGWGLTQQIRKYYEFGQVYHPEIIVLQFNANDMRDNLNNIVTTVDNNKFVFQESKSTVNWLKKYLSHSIIQKSQFYNLFRDSVYRLFEQSIVSKGVQNLQVGKITADAIPADQEFYVDLLDLFVNELSDSGIKIMMISVTGQLERVPYIYGKVLELQEDNLLSYVEVRDWLDAAIDYRSPEGHAWGERAHEIIGDNLSSLIRKIN